MVVQNTFFCKDIKKLEKKALKYRKNIVWNMFSFFLKYSFFKRGTQISLSKHVSCISFLLDVEMQRTKEFFFLIHLYLYDIYTNIYIVGASFLEVFADIEVVIAFSRLKSRNSNKRILWCFGF